MRKFSFNSPKFFMSLGLLALLLKPQLSFALELTPDFRRPDEVGFKASIASKVYDEQFKESDVAVGGPLYRDEDNVVALSLLGHDLHAEPATTLDGTSDTRPADLKARLLGGSYFHHGDDGRLQGVMASIGSASDEPFADRNVNIVSLTGVVKYPSETPHRAWLLLLNVSNDRPAFASSPIPGFAYQITNPEGTFAALLGFPFVWVESRQIRRTTVSANLLPWAYQGSASYRFYERLHGFVEFAYQPQVYFLHHRSQLFERLFYEEKSASLGTRLQIYYFGFAELRGGYSFNRSFAEGESIYSLTSGREVLKDDFFVRLALQAGF